MLRWSSKKPYSEDLHFVAIDRPSYRPEVGGLITEEELKKSDVLPMLLKNFPWNRAVWGHAIERLIEDGGADVVVLDLLLESPAKGDTYLRKVLREHRDSVVIGSRIDTQNFGGSIIQSFNAPTSSVLGPNPRDEAFLQKENGRAGHVNVTPDPLDGVVRSMTYHFNWHDEKIIPAISARALQKAEGKGYRAPDGKFRRRFRFSGPPATYPPRPIYELFVDDLWEANYTGEGSVEDGIVVIGPYGNWQQDYKQVPVSDNLMPGPELHLNAIAALQERSFLNSLPDIWGLYLILALGLFVLVLFLLFESTLLKLSLFVLFGSVYVLGAFTVFETWDFFVPVLFPLLAYTGNGLATFGYQYIRERREKQRIRGTLDRYISSDVASEILANQEDYLDALGGDRKEVTVLFSDIRSFTPISEELSSERLVTQLNEYLTPMTKIIQHRQGRLDKFIGDAVMAVWGDLFDRLSPEEEVNQAVRAGLEMLDRTEKLNERWTSEGYPPFEIGIGINRGSTVFGNLGAESRMEMTVIGDAVNQAARFEGLTKRYGISLIVGQSVHEQLSDSLLSFLLDRVRVKGKTEATEIYGVLGEREELDQSVFQDFRIFKEARDLYAEGSFEEARERFLELEDSDSFDQISRYYRDRLDELIQDPPEDWDGVWIMKSK
jgi:adenylate cyclase